MYKTIEDKQEVIAEEAGRRRKFQCTNCGDFYRELSDALWCCIEDCEEQEQ